MPLTSSVLNIHSVPNNLCESLNSKNSTSGATTADAPKATLLQKMSECFRSPKIPLICGIACLVCAFILIPPPIVLGLIALIGGIILIFHYLNSKNENVSPTHIQ